MDGIAWAASAMVAARARLEIATSNLANVSTSGYVRSVARAALTPFGVFVRRSTAATHGALRRTGRDFDLAIAGAGRFIVRDAAGRTGATRDGGFTRERDGTLRDARGRVLLAGGRALIVPEGGRIDERGRVVGPDGSATGARVPLPAGSSLREGFLEDAGVDAIAEMIDVLSAERSFESAQKVVTAIDRVAEKSGDVARVK
jgi:flagellar basal body rod protein FlgG